MQGDTLENVSTELDCIMKSGHFKLIIKPKKISETIAENNSEVLLHYEPTIESYLQKLRLQRLSVCHDNASSTSHIERQFSSVSEIWNSEQIDDFVRKLGFLEVQSADVGQKVKLFQQLNQVSLGDCFRDHYIIMYNIARYTVLCDSLALDAEMMARVFYLALDIRK